MEPIVIPPFRMKHITILSMDGGGVRGIIPAIVLQALEKEIQDLEGNDTARISDYFDIIAGTSAGGINASLLTAPDGQGRPKYTANDLVDFHLTKWAEIFPQISNENVKELLWASQLIGPKYQSENLFKVMEEMLGEAKLSNTTTHVVMPSFDIKKMQPQLFTTFQARYDPKTDAPLKHVTLATSSAPLYLPPYQFTEYHDADEINSTEYNVIDGYVVANNPAWIAVTEGLHEYTRTCGKSTETVGKLMILSLGTGNPKFVSKYDATNTSKWGLIQWLYSLENRSRPFTDVFQAAATSLVDIQLKCFLEAVGCTRNYVRIQDDDLPEDLVPVDNSDPENIKKLQERADKLVEDNRAKIKGFALKLITEKYNRMRLLAESKG